MIFFITGGLNDIKEADSWDFGVGMQHSGHRILFSKLSVYRFNHLNYQINAMG